MSGALWLSGVAALAGLVYVGESAWFLFGWCKCVFGCEGGRHYSKDRKHHHDCRWCRGSGRRLRIGRRVFNYFERKRRVARRGGTKR